MKISVLGGGHGCYAAAVEMAEKGHQVRLWRRDAAALKQLLEIGSLTVRDYRGTRQVSVGHPGDLLTLTDNLAEALGDAQLVIVPLPSTSHDDLARQVAPHLHDGQVLFLPPGTFGSYLFAKAMADLSIAAHKRHGNGRTECARYHEHPGLCCRPAQRDLYEQREDKYRSEQHQTEQEVHDGTHDHVVILVQADIYSRIINA